MPDIPLAVAVVILRIFLEAGRHELALAHRPGPGALHFMQGDIALFDNRAGPPPPLEEKGAAPTVEVEGTKRRNVSDPAGIFSKVGFHAPEGDHILRLHTVSGTDF